MYPSRGAEDPPSTPGTTLPPRCCADTVIVYEAPNRVILVLMALNLVFTSWLGQYDGSNRFGQYSEPLGVTSEGISAAEVLGFHPCSIDYHSGPSGSEKSPKPVCHPEGLERTRQAVRAPCKCWHPGLSSRPIHFRSASSQDKIPLWLLRNFLNLNTSLSSLVISWCCLELEA